MFEKMSGELDEQLKRMDALVKGQVNEFNR